MKVYIFKRSSDLKRDAGVIQSEIETLAGKQLEHSELKETRKEVLYKKAVKDSLAVKDNTEKTSFYIDPSLGFTENDIPDKASFGNGTSSGSIRLKDGSDVECTFFVVDKIDEAAFNSKVAQIKIVCEK